MTDTGFIKVAAAVPEVKVADCEFNIMQIKKLILDANQRQTDIVCFPELSVTAYTCGDLFFQQTLIAGAENGLQRLLSETTQIPVCFIVGAPVRYNSGLYNCAIICKGGRIYGIVPKIFLPNHEKRWFESYSGNNPATTIEYAGKPVPFGTNLLFNYHSIRFAVEICEDLWSVIPPSSNHAIAGARVVFNPSASGELIGKQHYVKSLISRQSARCHAAYVYASAGFGESTTDLVYAGNAFIYEDGHLLAESERFRFSEQLIVSEIDLDLLEAERRRNTTFGDQSSNVSYTRINIPSDSTLHSNQKPMALSRRISPNPFIPTDDYYDESCEEIFSIQVAGLAKRLLHTGVKSLLVGVSGGLDSTLALLVCAKTVDKLKLPRSMVCGVTMPGFGTSARTYTNAIRLMQSLGITAKEIRIDDACKQHFKDIGHDSSVHDVTYENTQTRERTQILMDLANQQNGLVIGTGDMSELALGWTTFNGDHISMYNVNIGIPKTLVRHLVKWAAETQMDEDSRITVNDVLFTPVSPELLPVDLQGQTTQFTEDLIGPYELHDFFLFYTLRYGFTSSKIYFLAQQAFCNVYNHVTILNCMETFFRRFFSQQFKRNCMPDGAKVGFVGLSPRGDWRMPSDACVSVWLKEIEMLKKRNKSKH